MLAPDVRFEGFTTTDWTRFLSLFRPRAAERDLGEGGDARAEPAPQGGVIAVFSGKKLHKLVHTRVGRLRIDEVERDWPLSARDLATRHHAAWAAILERGVLEDIMDRFAGRIRRGDDLTVQITTLLQVFREEVFAGRLDLWPQRLRGVPIPPAAVVTGTLDTVCRPGRALVMGVFEDEALWTAIVLRRKAEAPTGAPNGEKGFGAEAPQATGAPSVRKGFDLIMGPDELRAEMGFLAGDWRRDYRHLAQAIERRAGPIGLGCFGERATFRELFVDPTPGAWARAAAVRDVILSPVPPAMAIPLGIDAGRAAVTTLRALTERVDPLGLVVPMVKALLGEKDEKPVPTSFHPLELLRRLLQKQ